MARCSMRRMSKLALEHPGVANAVAFPGLSVNGFVNASNAGIVFVILKPSEERQSRELAAASIVQDLTGKFGGIEEAFVAIFPPPPVQGLGSIGGFKLYVEDRASLDRARDMTADFTSSNDGKLLDTNGWVHIKRGEFAEALPVLDRAIDREPKSSEIRYHLGMAELYLGHTERARADLEAALAGSAQFYGSDEARSTLASLKGGASG